MQTCYSLFQQLEKCIGFYCCSTPSFWGHFLWFKCFLRFKNQTSRVHSFKNLNNHDGLGVKAPTMTCNVASPRGHLSFPVSYSPHFLSSVSNKHIKWPKIFITEETERSVSPLSITLNRPDGSSIT